MRFEVFVTEDAARDMQTLLERRLPGGLREKSVSAGRRQRRCSVEITCLAGR